MSLFAIRCFFNTDMALKLTCGGSILRSTIRALMLILLLLSSQAATEEVKANRILTPAIYHWSGADGDWQVPTSWIPVRTEPVPEDVLFFDSGGTVTVSNVPSQTIAQLIVTTDTTVDLYANTDTVLVIAGGTGDDLVVDKDSALNFRSIPSIVSQLLTETTASIRGSIMFTSSGSAGHRLIAADRAAVTFNDQAVFTAGNGFAGNPFGTENLNSVVFAGGSTYVCKAGEDPFGAPQPASVAVFKRGSLFSLQGQVTPSFSGRTYSNFEVNYYDGLYQANGSGAWAVDDLTVTAGRLDLYLQGDHSIRGNITISEGTRLSFMVGTYYLNGVAEQFVTGTGAQSAGGQSTLVVDNPSGVILGEGRPFGLWNLWLKNGVVTVADPTWWLSIPGTVTRTNGHVDGNLRRWLNLPGSYVFDVGTENSYSPIRVEVTSATFPTVLMVRAVQKSHPAIHDPTRALKRYWQVYGPQMTADLTFNYSDPLDIPPTADESNFVIQRYRNGFTQPSGFIDTSANTFKVNGITDLAYVDWTLAEPGAIGTPTPTPTATPTASPTPISTRFDYDGDGRSDISVFRPSNGNWYIQCSTSGFTGVNFGIGTDRIVPADYDGDGKTDIAVYRPSTGTWYVMSSSTGTVTYMVFGLAEDLPTSADYDGDGKVDISVFRPSSGTWYRQNSSSGAFVAAQFGANDDKPTIGDFDGDGKADLAVFRPSTGAWYQTWSSNGFLFGEQFGISTDKATPTDYDGDRKTDIAIYRPSEGLWYVKLSATGSYSPFIFGLAEDIPVPADFDGDGRADIGVFRPSDGTWYIVNSSSGSYTISQFGQNGDRPPQSAFGAN